MADVMRKRNVRSVQTAMSSVRVHVAITATENTAQVQLLYCVIIVIVIIILVTSAKDFM